MHNKSLEESLEAQHVSVGIILDMQPGSTLCMLGYIIQLEATFASILHYMPE